VIGAGDQRHPPAESWIDHGCRLLFIAPAGPLHPRTGAV
jgi:hypothetical protein